MLKKRIITACILIPIVVASLWILSPPLFSLLSAIVVLIAVWEWSYLLKLTKTWQRFLYVIATCFLFFASLLLSVQFILKLALLWWLIAWFLVIIYPKGSHWFATSTILRGLIGVMVLLPFWVALNYLRNQHDGVYMLLFLFALIWSADSAAYFTGKYVGKTKLAATVSPGKTWQGLYGALMATLLISAIAFWVCRIPMIVWPWGMLLALVTVIFSIVGDLFESMMKRQAALKDSSQLLPGHGGLLDRIDSLTAATPIFALGARWLGAYLS